MKELIRPPSRGIDDKGSIDAIMKWAQQVSRVINNIVSNIPADSTAVDVAGVVSDLNDFQDVLRELNAR